MKMQKVEFEKQFTPKNKVKDACQSDCDKQMFCDSKDGKWISMCQSFYICHPQTIPESYLKDYNCIECGKVAKVISTGPYCGAIKPTGFILKHMDEDQNVSNIGVICEKCIDKLWAANLLSMCGGGEYFRNAQPDPDFYLEKSWKFKHPEFMFPLEEEDEDYYEEDDTW